MATEKEEQSYARAQAKTIGRVSSTEKTLRLNPVFDFKSVPLYPLHFDEKERSALNRDGSSCDLGAPKHSSSSSTRKFFDSKDADYQAILNDDAFVHQVQHAGTADAKQTVREEPGALDEASIELTF